MRARGLGWICLGWGRAEGAGGARSLLDGEGWAGLGRALSPRRRRSRLGTLVDVLTSRSWARRAAVVLLPLLA